jgi:CRISPR-associated endonuclease/helicase Cas3
MTDLPFTDVQLLALWGKTCRHEDDPEHYGSRYHPLLFHLLDVAHAALALWIVLPNAFKKRIACALKCDVETARWRVAFLAGVHDLGKANPYFQFQPTTLGEWMPRKLAELGLSRPPKPENAPHNFVSAKELRRLLRDAGFFWHGGDERSNTVLAHITGAHHGTFPSSGDYASWNEDVLGDARWHDVRLALLHQLRAALCPPDFAFPVAAWEESATGAVPQLAGFISVADWIGSSFELVGHRDKTPTLDEYLSESKRRAREALRKFGWAATPAPPGASPDFAAFWGFTPNALQEAVNRINSEHLRALPSANRSTDGCGQD